MAEPKDEIKFTKREDVIENWDNKVHLIRQYSSKSVPSILQAEVQETIEKLVPLFHKLCELGGIIQEKKTIPIHSIE